MPYLQPQPQPQPQRATSYVSRYFIALALKARATRRVAVVLFISSSVNTFREARSVFCNLEAED
jgi:hypothetical protein